MIVFGWYGKINIKVNGCAYGAAESDYQIKRKKPHLGKWRKSIKRWWRMRRHRRALQAIVVIAAFFGAIAMESRLDYLGYRGMFYVGHGVVTRGWYMYVGNGAGMYLFFGVAAVVFSILVMCERPQDPEKARRFGPVVTIVS
ncbi:MAG: hypothetical protein LKJ66_14875 [Clostridium luticellarii]|uniref:hypothetical protein n=1 Tax=Clostridium luticellarii TaxID=1691940 RepID=UPI0023537798|nr:hypothetical protein [Clostridium luticellarii]MCI1996890.1 hypothetical protein [Clostridium luticellarii]MCI2041333.1 hypothetical protein [Clostridium luticellarii]